MANISERLDRLSITPLHKQAVIALSFAYFFELADLNTFGFAAPGVIRQWNVPTSDIALAISASFGGMFLGGAGGGWFADKLGRKTSLIIAVSIYTLASLANAVSWDIISLSVFRFITGIGLSAMTVIANTYVGEVFPARLRGKFLGRIVTIGLLGIPATAWVARFLVPVAPWTWRLVFVWGALGAFAFVFILRIPESPRWLALRGREEEAEKSIAAFEQSARANNMDLPELLGGTTEERNEPPRYADLFKRKQLGRSILLVIAWVFQTLGFYGFVAWVPTLLVKHGFSIVQSLTFSSLIAICNPLGAYIASYLVERIERKWFIIGDAIFIAVCGLAYGLTFQPALIVLFGALVVIGIQGFAVGLYVYTPELYPTRLRSSGHGLCYGMGRLANVAGPFIVSQLYGGYGYPSVFIYIAGCWVLTAIAVSFGPRTTGRSLETLNPA